MEDVINPETAGQFQFFWDQLYSVLIDFTQRWRLYQIIILLSIFAVSHVFAMILAPRMKEWMRLLEGWPKWRLRFLLLVQQRFRFILFVLVCWIVYLTMRELTWPSRSYLIGIVTNLVTAWLVISIVSRIIRNRLLRRFVRWGVLIYVTLTILGLSETARNVLDRIAIDIGSLHISLLMIIKTVVTLAVLFAGARMLSSAGSRRIEAVEDLSPSMKVLSIKGMQVTLYAIALIVGFQAVGFDMTSLTVLSGAIGLGLGFGLQKVVSNLVSGVILLLDKSIKPGDVISLDNTFGWISSLGARYVSVLTRNGTEFLIPNEDLITNRVVNWSHSSDLVRLDIHFGVSYKSDPHEVKRICSIAPLEVKRVISTPAPVCHVTGFGESSIDFILRFWIKDPTKGLTNVRGDVYLALWDALKEANIEIPYPRRDVTIIDQSMPKQLD